jgi:hypothetical protein
MGLMFACLLVAFSSLTVTVSSNAVEARFGPGWIGKRIPLEEVASCRAVRNLWIYGWGVRLIPGGWLYNVSGPEAVELTLTTGVFRIGTDEPQVLCAAIQGKLDERAGGNEEALRELELG